MAEIVKKERVPYRIWDKVNSKWNELMLKTNAKSVDAADGKTLETKIGAVNGITSDLNGEAEDVAASIKCVNQLNNSLGVDIKLIDGVPNWSKRGADTWNPFSSGIKCAYIFGYISGTDAFYFYTKYKENIGRSEYWSYNSNTTKEDEYLKITHVPPHKTTITFYSKCTAFFTDGTQTEYKSGDSVIFETAYRNLPKTIAVN